MKLAIIAMAMGGFLSACATATPAPTASAAADLTGYGRMSCRQITAALESTQRAYDRATGKQGPSHVGEPMASLYAPISYVTSQPSSVGRLKARLEDLQRASRARRCGSAGPKYPTA
jgi:hypothetical protein